LVNLKKVLFDLDIIVKDIILNSVNLFIKT